MHLKITDSRVDCLNNLGASLPSVGLICVSGLGYCPEGSLPVPTTILYHCPHLDYWLPSTFLTLISLLDPQLNLSISFTYYPLSLKLTICRGSNKSKREAVKASFQVDRIPHLDSNRQHSRKTQRQQYLCQKPPDSSVDQRNQQIKYLLWSWPQSKSSQEPLSYGEFFPFVCSSHFSRYLNKIISNSVWHICSSLRRTTISWANHGSIMIRLGGCKTDGHRAGKLLVGLGCGKCQVTSASLIDRC